jgi:hypothetical protein
MKPWIESLQNFHRIPENNQSGNWFNFPKKGSAIYDGVAFFYWW